MDIKEFKINKIKYMDLYRLITSCKEFGNKSHLSVFITYLTLKTMSNKIAFTYYEHNKLIGLCIMNGSMIDVLMVHPDYRSKGIGAKLIPNYANYVKLREEALNFYKKNNFEVSDILYEENLKRYIMIRKYNK